MPTLTVLSIDTAHSSLWFNCGVCWLWTSHDMQFSIYRLCLSCLLAVKATSSVAGQHTSILFMLFVTICILLY